MQTPQQAPSEIDNPQHRQAWADLAAGRSVADTATAVGVTPRTIDRWIAKWRSAYGDDLFVDSRDAAGRARLEAANAERNRRWIERTTAIESLLGDVATLALTNLRAMLEAGALIAPKDLAVVAGILIDKGQLLSGAPTSRTAGAASQADIDRALDEMLEDARDVVRSANT